jgi:hypothetical protein
MSQAQGEAEAIKGARRGVKLNPAFLRLQNCRALERQNLRWSFRPTRTIPAHSVIAAARFRPKKPASQ